MLYLSRPARLGAVPKLIGQFVTDFHNGIMRKESLLSSVRQKFEALSPLLHEKAQRRWAACEALALGRGGISVVAEATRLSRTTIAAGIQELQHPDAADHAGDADRDRIRRPGAGRPRLTTNDRALLQELQHLVDPAPRGDPMSPLLWTCKSTRKLAEALAELGHDVSHQTVARLLDGLG